MPILNLRVSGPLTADQATNIANALADLTESILGKDRALTAIAMVPVDRGQWFIGGKSLAATGRASFGLEIKITDETNTKAQKARYIHAVFTSMQGLLGDLDERSYVHVHDVRAAAYGYGGKTQEYRLHSS